MLCHSNNKKHANQSSQLRWSLTSLAYRDTLSFPVVLVSRTSIHGLDPNVDVISSHTSLLSRMVEVVCGNGYK